MRDRMDDHLIQEPRIRRVVRRQPPAPAPRSEDTPPVPTPRRAPRDEPSGD